MTKLIKDSRMNKRKEQSAKSAGGGNRAALIAAKAMDDAWFESYLKANRVHPHA